MKLRKIVLTSLFLIFVTAPGFSLDKPYESKTTVPAETPGAIRAQQLVSRLEEIKSIDVRTLSKKEKRELRAEVKSIKREMREIHNGGVYISVGGIIIIILLLILLL